MSGLRALRMEFFKCKRRKIWLAPLIMIAAQLMWGFYSYRDMTPTELLEGWQDILYGFPILNSMMIPVIAAVVASRVADIEHKGQTWKLLETIQPTGQLFDAKFFCAAYYVFIAMTLQTLAITGFGIRLGFGEGSLPTKEIFIYYISSMLVTMCILLLQYILSLLIPNQMIGMILGLVGSFLGLFSLFFPRSLQNFCLWSYYGILMNALMDWNQELKVVHHYFCEWDKTSFLILFVVFLLAYSVGRRLFVRREV